MATFLANDHPAKPPMNSLKINPGILENLNTMKIGGLWWVATAFHWHGPWVLHLAFQLSLTYALGVQRPEASAEPTAVQRRRTKRRTGGGGEATLIESGWWLNTPN